MPNSTSALLLFASWMSKTIRCSRRSTTSWPGQSLLGDLDSAERPLTLVGIVSHSAASTQARLQVQRFTMQRQEITAPTSGETTKNDTQEPETIVQTTLELSGIALDDMAVARFITALRETGVFVQVELKSSLSTQIADNPAKEYLVRCTF